MWPEREIQGVHQENPVEYERQVAILWIQFVAFPPGAQIEILLQEPFQNLKYRKMNLNHSARIYKTFQTKLKNFFNEKPKIVLY